jgi:hypothetical protein
MALQTQVQAEEWAALLQQELKVQTLQQQLALVTLESLGTLELEVLEGPQKATEMLE